MEKAGHTVQKAIGRKAVDEALKKSTFDLLVLGATMTRNDRHHLPYMAKKANAEISVLVLHADGTRHPYVDGCVDTGASIENILNRIESMKHCRHDARSQGSSGHRRQVAGCNRVEKAGSDMPPFLHLPK